MPETWMDRYERDALGQPGAARYNRPPRTAEPEPDDLGEWTRDWRAPQLRSLAADIATGLREVAIGLAQGIRDYLTGGRR